MVPLYDNKDYQTKLIFSFFICDKSFSKYKLYYICNVLVRKMKRFLDDREQNL